VEALVERVRAVEAGGGAAADRQTPRVATGWDDVDAVLGGGLLAGAVHEWFPAPAPGSAPGPGRNPESGKATDPGSAPDSGNTSDSAYAASTGALNGADTALPPLALLMHLARQALNQPAEPGWSVWVGRRCFAYPHGWVTTDGPSANAPRHDAGSDTSAGGDSGGSRGSKDSGGSGGLALIHRALWVDPPDAAGRLWAIDLATRCEAVAVVVADGSGLDMAATRRLQLAAESARTLVLLARPGREMNTLSAARTRWRVAPAVSDTDQPLWDVTLWRCKGAQRGRQAREGEHTWRRKGRRSHGQGLVVVPAEPGDRSAAADITHPSGAARAVGETIATPRHRQRA